MKSRLINILLLVLFSTSLVAQSSSVSAVGSLSVGKNIVPPNIDINGISFIDPNGNNIIDANELCYIVLDITNKGLGDGVGLSAKISATGNKQAISFSSTELSSLKSGESIRVRIPIESTSFTQDGSIDFDVYIAEINVVYDMLFLVGIIGIYEYIGVAGLAKFTLCNTST